MNRIETEGLRHEQSTPSRRPPNFSKGVFFTGSGTAINIALLFMETMVAVRMLDTESYGLYVLMIVVINFLLMVVDFGYKTGMTQLIASSNPVRQAALANNALVFRLAAIAAISVFIWLSRDLLILLDPSQVLLQYIFLIPVMLLVASLDELFTGVLQGFQAYHHMAVAQIIRSVMRLCLSVLFLVVFDLGVMALIYSWIVSFGISAFYQFLVFPFRKRFVLQRPLLSEMLRFSYPLQLNRFLWFASSRIEILLLGALIGPIAVAFYNVAVSIPNALLRLTQSYTAVFFPFMTELLAEEKRTQAVRLLDRSLRLISFLLALIALISVLFSQQIVTLLFSEKYLDSSPVFAILMIVLHMTVLVTLMGYSLTADGYPGRSLGVNTFRTILMVITDLIFIPVFGFIGPAIAKLVAYYVANPISVWLLRHSDIRVSVFPYVKQTALLWLCVALFWWIQPAAFAFKMVIILLFVVLNVALSTISHDDLTLVLPDAVTKRLGVRKETLSNDRW